MPGVYEYVIQMQDRASGTLQKLTGSSLEAAQKFTQLQEKTKALQRHTKDFGNGISSLKQKIDILQNERDLIDKDNLPKIRQYNKEISKLNRQIQTLETTTSGNKFKTYAKDAMQQIPGAGLLTNPLVLAGAGVAAVGKLGVSWDEGMAKINATAQLSQDELDDLGSTIKKLGTNAGADLSRVPDAYEKILSQTGDVALSTDILATSLQGAKAGFTDVDVVAGAVGQSLSAIGKGKETAAEVMDVLFAAKRVGAGEFSDFASNIPGLIASGQNVGVTFREVSGAFAYMTGKGNDASSSTMLLQNAFTALGKSEITSGLKAAGVEVYDAEGKMRGLLPIMEELSGVMGSMSDQQRSDFLESIGLRDAQAKQAFSVLTNDTNKLREAMSATANANGEMQNALDNTANPANKMREAMAKLQSVGLELGGAVVTILNPVLDVLIVLLTGIGAVVSWVSTTWQWWTGLLQQGNPWIIGLTVIIGALTTAIALHNLWLKKDVIWTKLVTTSKTVWAAVTGVLTGATWGLNTALLANPITWVVVAVMGLVAAFVAAWKHSEKFRGAITGMWEVIKGFGNIIKDFVIDRIKGLLGGLGKMASAISKLFSKDFKGAWQDAKSGFADMSGITAVKNAVESGKELGDKFKTGYQKGVKGFAQDKIEAGFVKDEETGKWVKKEKEAGAEPTVDLSAMGGTPPPLDYDALMAKLNPTKKKKTGAAGQKGSDSLSLGVPQDYNQSAAYSQVTSKFGAQVDLAMTPQPPKGGENPTEKPVINMATRVNEIAGSLKKMAAAATVPVVMAVGAQTADAGQLAPMPEPVHQMAETTEKLNPVNVPENTLYENHVNQEENNLFNQVASTANNYDQSTRVTNNSRTDNRNRTTHNTTNEQGKTVYIDRFTDKIEINVSGSDDQASAATAERIRDEVEKALAEILNV